MSEMTRAEAKARYYAERVAGYMGFRADVKVDQEAASFYSDGRVMFPASEVAWVTIVDESWMGDRIMAGWRTYLPEAGMTDWDGKPLRSTTRLVGASKIRGCPSRKRPKSVVRIKNETHFAREVGYLRLTDEVRREIAAEKAAKVADEK
jgi:hypothetical protein